MHESGHFLHGLGSEYCCNGGYFSASIPRNIDSSQANCQSTATSIGVATSLCVQIGTTGSWRIDDGSAEIMVDGGNTAADWRDAAARVRSEERRVGEAGVSKGRSRWPAINKKKKK